MNGRLRAEYRSVSTEEDLVPEHHHSQDGDDTSTNQVDGMNADANVSTASDVATSSAVAVTDNHTLAEEAPIPGLQGQTTPLLVDSADKNELGTDVASGQSSIGGVVDAVPIGDGNNPDGVGRSISPSRNKISQFCSCLAVLLFIGVCIRYLPRRISRWFPPPTGACGGPQRCHICTLRPTLPLWRWMCDECSLGYRLSDDTCEANLCTCDGGSEAIHTNCTENGAEKCTECDSGYHLFNHRCLKNQCFCGKGTISHTCDIDGMERCSDCDDGFHLAAWSCELNRCFCRKGVGINGTGCDHHGTEECSRCNGGLHLVKKHCVKNLCQCQNGLAETGEDCKEDGAHQCKECDLGWHLNTNSRFCIANNCTCDHGSPTKGKSCTLDGAHICAECYAGFHLVGGLCAENRCHCRGGTAMNRVYCDRNEAWNCSECDLGFHMLGAHCDPFVNMYAISEKLHKLTGMPALRADLENRKHTVILLSSKDDISWNSNAAAVLLLPELFHSVGLDYRQRKALDSWIQAGGHLISCGDFFGHNGRLLNVAFDWKLQGTLTSNRPSRSRFCSILCKGPDVLEWSSSLSCFAKRSLPSGAKPAYGSNRSVCAFTTSRGKGRVTYLGFNWYNASGASGSDREAGAGWRDVLEHAILGTGLNNSLFP